MKRKIKENKLNVVWKQAEDISKKEAEQRLGEAFNILFIEAERRLNDSEKQSGAK